MKIDLLRHGLHGMFYLMAVLTAIIVGAGTIVTSPADAADPMPANDSVNVKHLGPAGSGPIVFDGGPPGRSGLASVALGDTNNILDLSNDNGIYRDDPPSADTNGYGATATGIRVPPSGIRTAGAGFFLHHGVRVV